MTENSDVPLKKQDEFENELKVDPENEALYKAIRASRSLVDVREMYAGPKLRNMEDDLGKSYERISKYINTTKEKGNAFEPAIAALGIGFDVMQQLAAEGPQPDIKEFVSKLGDSENNLEFQGMDNASTMQILENGLGFLKKAIFAKDVSVIALKYDSPGWHNPAVAQAIIEGINRSRSVLHVLRPHKKMEGSYEYNKALESYLQNIQDELREQSGRDPLPKIPAIGLAVKETKKRRHLYAVPDPPDEIKTN